MYTNKTIWTDEMIDKIIKEFPVRFTKDIAKDLNLGYRTIIRKARELGVEKIENFKAINQSKINQLISENHAPNPYKGQKGFIIPNSKKYHFKKGEKPNVDYSKIVDKRNELIRKEKMRLRYGLAQKSKIKITNIY